MLGELAEDADQPVAAVQRHRADVDRQAPAGLVEEHDLGIRDVGRSGDLLREDLTCAPRVLGHDHRRELPAADVAEEPLRGRVRSSGSRRSVDQ